MQRDGALVVDERITFSYSGDFSGAFREIPLADGEQIADVAVFEGDRAYTPGASAELGSTGAPDTFGMVETSKGLRLVWHYRALSEERTFRIHYRLSGLATAYDDVVDVNLKVWGDEWQVGLGRLTGRLVAPGEVTRAWGHPVGVRGDVTLDGSIVRLRALDWGSLRQSLGEKFVSDIVIALGHAARALKLLTPQNPDTIA